MPEERLADRRLHELIHCANESETGWLTLTTMEMLILAHEVLVSREILDRMAKLIERL